MPKTVYYSVITGDLISSEQVDPQAVTAMLQQMEVEMAEHLYPIGEMVFQYRGDGIQLMSREAEMGVSVMLLVKAWLTWKSHEYVGHTLDTRLYLGIGEAVLGTTLGNSGGEAFVLSGRGLDGLKAPHTMGIATYRGTEADLPLHHLLTLLDELCSRWAQRQGETAYHLLQGKNYNDIALMTGKHKSTVGEAGRSLGWPRLEPAVKYVQAVLRQMT